MHNHIKGTIDDDIDFYCNKTDICKTECQSSYFPKVMFLKNGHQPYLCQIVVQARPPSMLLSIFPNGIASEISSETTRTFILIATNEKQVDDNSNKLTQLTVLIE